MEDKGVDLGATGFPVNSESDSQYSRDTDPDSRCQCDPWSGDGERSSEGYIATPFGSASGLC